MENADFQKEFHPIWCDKCEKLGFIFVDDPQQPAFVVCSKCGHETSQVWCPNCGMGGEYVRKIHKRPPSWTCHGCHTEYQLPSDFYEKPIKLYLEKELPKEILKRVIPPNQRKYKLAIRLMGLTAIAGLVSIFYFTEVNKYLLVAIIILVWVSLLLMLGRWATKLSGWNG